jgi:hypothetical protein
MQSQLSTNQSQGDAWWMCIWKMSRLGIFYPDLLQSVRQAQRTATDLEPCAGRELDVLTTTLWLPLGDNGGKLVIIRQFLQQVKLYYEKGDQQLLQEAVHNLVILLTKKKRRQWAALLFECQELPGGGDGQCHTITINDPFGAAVLASVGYTNGTVI